MQEKTFSTYASQQNNGHEDQHRTCCIVCACFFRKARSVFESSMAFGNGRYDHIEYLSGRACVLPELFREAVQNLIFLCQILVTKFARCNAESLANPCVAGHHLSRTDIEFTNSERPYQ